MELLHVVLKPFGIAYVPLLNRCGCVGRDSMEALPYALIQGIASCDGSSLETEHMGIRPATPGHTVSHCLAPVTKAPPCCSPYTRVLAQRHTSVMGSVMSPSPLPP